MTNIIEQNFENVDLELITEEILQLKNQTASNMIEIGKKLIQVKGNLPHGQFGKYLEEKVSFKKSTANNFMKVAIEFSNFQSLGDLEPTKLILLLDIPKEERAEFIETNNVEDMSTRELTKKIKEIKDNKKAIKKAEKESKVIIKDVIIIEDVEIIENVAPIAPVAVTNSVNTEKILNKVDTLIKVITICTGYFENFTDYINCDSRGGIIAQLYVTGVISKEELIATVIAYNIGLEINFKELNDGTAKENYTNNICNSYYHYKSTKDESYFSILNKEMCYENVMEFTWEKNKKERLEYIEQNQKKVFKRDNITIARGFNEDNAMLCVYKKRENLGHYNIDTEHNLEDVTKLFKLYKIDKSYLDLVESFIKMIKEEQLGQKNKIYDDAKKKAKFISYQTNLELDYTFILKDKPYENAGDRIYIFDGIDLLGKVTLIDVLGGDNFDIDLDNNETLIKLVKKVDAGCWRNFKEILWKENIRLFDIRVKKERANKKEWEEEAYKSYKKSSSNSFEDLFGDATVKAEDKPIYKKLYKTLAMAYHPDKGGTNEEMAMVNHLKEVWGIN
ncbi:DUF3102 domain-containing protein [Clostridium tagluense]|uniref:J domain-containing protein n=1 Tax=Clostridium tagluense TaxID=360422 RepID=A0A401UPD2_9CLOT|nr:DUF3102 domain-containing protein [Clostridium tagluense]GCD11403.1 hypothetical protein Ctaglu_30260 [Clostridium tagluense]